MKKYQDNLIKAKYAEWQTSLFGACFIAFGLGSLFSSYFVSFAPVVILAGIALHLWGMYKIHRRNS